jgi:hypothetical protein
MCLWKGERDRVRHRVREDEREGAICYRRNGCVLILNFKMNNLPQTNISHAGDE